MWLPDELPIYIFGPNVWFLVKVATKLKKKISVCSNLIVTAAILKVFKLNEEEVYELPGYTKRTDEYFSLMWAL